MAGGGEEGAGWRASKVAGKGSGKGGVSKAGREGGRARAGVPGRSEN